MLDPKLPQLETALSAEAMRSILSSAWVDDRFEIRNCTIGHVRHKPGRNCLIRYDVAIRDRARGEESTQVLCARFYEPGQSESRWSRAQSAPLVDVTSGPQLAHMPGLGMVLWAFPNERKLRGLELLFDTRRLQEEVLPALLGCTLHSVQVKLVRYIPEHGCTVRVCASSGTIVHTLYGKIQTGDAAQRAFHLMRQFRKEVWFHEATQSLWQAEVPGKIAGWSNLPACARALAKLHQQPVEELPHNTREENLPALSGNNAVRAANIVLQAKAQFQQAPPLVTLHGDLHLKNFLVDDNGNAELIDLDTLCAGNPLSDLGSFAASLFHRAALGEVAYSEALDGINEFAEEYRRHVPWLISDGEFAASTAHAIVTQRIARSISRKKGDVVEALLNIAESLLQPPNGLRARHTRFASEKPGTLLDVHYKTWRKQKSWTKSHVTVAWNQAGAIEVERWGAVTGRMAAWRFPQDPAAPWMAIAADPTLVLDHLPVANVRVEGIDILNYRPESRFTARYRLIADGGTKIIYGKTYVDDRGLQVNERFTELWALGLLRAKPLGYSASIRTVWQEAFHGEPLRDHAEHPELLRQAGLRLRELHNSAIACPQRFTLEYQHTDVSKKLAKLAVVIPRFETRFRQVGTVLAAMLPTVPAASTAVVHGDFHIRQLMVSDRKEVALFDFDEIGVGDPVEDFGHFLADLHGDGFDGSFVNRAAEALLAGYGQPVPNERLRWHTAVQLLTRAYRALLQLKPDFEARVEQHLTLAEEEL